MRRNKTLKIDAVIGQFLKETNLEPKLKEVQLMKSWEKVIGKNVASATTGLYIKNQVLYVRLNSSIVRNELMLIRDGLIQALNREVDDDVIRNIVLR